MGQPKSIPEDRTPQSNLTAEDVQKLGPRRTREWRLYYQYQISRCFNDLIFYRAKFKQLNLHLKMLNKYPDYLERINGKVPEKEN